MRKFKIGDKVRVLVSDSFVSCTEKGSLHTIDVIDFSDATLKLSDEFGYLSWVYMSDAELVDENSKMTFPEMAQKLIDGEFKVGTELVMCDRSGNKKFYKVRKNMHGYGIDTAELADSPTLPSKINGTWTIKQQPIKEMSLKEIQEQLGFEIKIVEKKGK